MLMALLYSAKDRIVAAALACDQTPFGNRYWQEVHPAEIKFRPGFQTSYVNVADPELRNRLLQIGLDDALDGVTLAKELESIVRLRHISDKAA